MKKFNLLLLCFLAILILIEMVFPLLATAIAEAESDLFCKQKPKVAADLSPSDLPESFVLGDYDGASPSAILELQASSARGSILEYTLTGSSDIASYEITPFSRITSVQDNGSTIALVRNNPENGDFMWLSRYTGVFPPVSPSEALEVLRSNGYNVQDDSAKLVFFDYENYWMLNVTMDGGVTNAFVSLSSQEIKLSEDMLLRLIDLSSDHSGIPYGSPPSTEATSELAMSTSLPSSYRWMVGKVPYFWQGATSWCSVYSAKQVFWWFGTTFNGHYVDEWDIANYFGIGTDTGIEIEQTDQAFVHFMGHDNGDNLDHSWGSSNIEIEKSWIYSNAPTICSIRAPGTGAGDDINHDVTLIGWDDSLGGGSWCLHDTAAHINNASYYGVGWDVWISYETFDTYWNKRWATYGGAEGRRGSVSAIPGDGTYPDPKVEIQGLPPTGTTAHADQTFTLSIWLENQGTDAGLAAYAWLPKAQGAFIRLEGAEFDDAFQGEFDEYQSYDAYGNEVPISGAKIIEFHSDMPLGRPGFDVPIFGRITIRPTAGQVTLHYRGWITDEDDVVREDWDEGWDDDRPDWYWIVHDAPVAEYRIVRDPADAWNDRDDFLDYPVRSVSFALPPENPELTSPTHSRGQISCDQVLTVEWETPYAHGGVGGYSYTIVSQDDPYYDVNRTPDDIIDLDGSVTSFTTQPLEPDHVWEFNIMTIDSEGVSARFYSSFWVEIEECSVVITRPRSGDLFEVGEWVNVFWEPVTWGGDDVGGAYDGDTIDLLKGPDFVTNLVSNYPNILSAGFPVPDVEPGSDYKIRIILDRNAAGDILMPELPETLVGFSDYFSIAIPQVVVDVVAGDPSGHFSVTIDAGADKEAPVTSWTEISTTNIASYTITLTDGDTVMIIEGQLEDPNLEGQIVLQVDPVGVIIRYEVNIAVYVPPNVESCDSTGAKRDIFDPSEEVYVIGSGYSTSTTYDIYIVEDVAAWTDGVAIPSSVYGTATSVSSDAIGNIPPTLVWSHPLVLGRYDIVVDVNGNGVYDEGVDALDDSDIQVTAGFLVIPEVPLGTIVASTAMILALVAYVALPRWRRKRT